MTAIETLFDAMPASDALTPALRALYGGDLVIPAGSGTRPYVYANFVTTLDGVVSYGLPGSDTGNAISGGNEPDHQIMGLARTWADAVIWGAGTYAASRRFTPTPGAIWPPGTAEYAAQRARLGLAPVPLAVVVTRSGAIPTDGAILRRADQPAAVYTTAAGAARLTDLAGAPGTVVRPLPELFTPGDLLADLAREFGARRVLVEGGPTLLARWVAAGVVDEILLTTAPQLAGRDAGSVRPALLQGVAFTPGTAPWLELVSLKRAGSVLFARYRRIVAG